MQQSNAHSFQTKADLAERRTQSTLSWQITAASMSCGFSLDILTVEVRGPDMRLVCADHFSRAVTHTSQISGKQEDLRFLLGFALHQDNTMIVS